MTPGSASPKLLQGPEGRTLRSLMVPMLIGMVAMIVYNLADIYFVAQLGTAELTALSFTIPVVFFVGSITVGFGNGTSAVCARLYGENRVEDIGRVTMHAVFLGAATCIALIIIGLSTIDPLFRLLGASDATLLIIERYMRIYYFGLLFIVGPLIANPVLRSSGDARTPAMIMLVSAGVNIILDPILIFGLLGAPRLGIEGAAVANVIANFVAMVAAFAALYYRANIVFPKTPALGQLFESWRSILHVGIPATTSAAIAPITTAFITHQIAGFGQSAVAGYGIASRMESLALLVMVALGTAVTPFVGQNFGARRMDRVANGIRWCQRFFVAYGVAVAVVLAVAAPYIVAAFTVNETAISAALLHMRIVPASYLAVGFALAATNSLNAIGRPLPAMFISLTRTILVYAPLAYAFSQVLGLVGIFVAAFTANFIAGALGLILYRRILLQIR